MSNYPSFPPVGPTDLEQVFEEVSSLVQSKYPTKRNWNVGVQFTSSKMSSSTLSQLLSVLVPSVGGINYTFSTTPGDIGVYDAPINGGYPQVALVRGQASAPAGSTAESRTYANTLWTIITSSSSLDLRFDSLVIDQAQYIPNSPMAFHTASGPISLDSLLFPRRLLKFMKS